MSGQEKAKTRAEVNILDWPIIFPYDWVNFEAIDWGRDRQLTRRLRVPYREMHKWHNRRRRFE